MQCQRVDLLWQREHHMIVSAWQQICFALLYPFFALMSLALRAMTIAATVVTDVYRTARTARIHMTAQSRCSALSNGSERFLLMNRKRSIADSCVAQHIGYFVLRLHSANTLSNGLLGN